MNQRQERKGYQALLDSGAVSKEELEKTLLESEKNHESFSELLVKKGVISEPELLKHYSNAFGVPFVSLKRCDFGKEIFEKVPVKLAWYYHLFPYAYENGKLTIAVSRPVDVNFIDEVRFGLGMEVDVVLATRREIEEMLHRYYGLGADTVDRILTQTEPQTLQNRTVPLHADVEDIEGLTENASVIHLVNQILLEACRKGASDIHLEPFRGKVRLRYRIDGVLHEAPVHADMKKFFNAIISRIKIMANLNIVERRLPQDGKARVKTQEQMLDLRISSIPTPHGESLVIRILPGKMIKDLKDLGLEPEQGVMFKDLLKSPYGIIFVTGPTGSGKSTTLYAGLSTLNRAERKIITIEDPVEYEMEEITQIQVNPEVGLTFAQGLRSVLRHDPDVMMVGEVRDLETADIAIRVALTGHLILSTLHTNDASSGVTRLLDIGVAPYLVASSVIAFIGQRLVRCICPFCKEEDLEVMEEIREMIRREMSLPKGEMVKVYRGKGCDHCSGSGFSGRVAIYEILIVTEAVRKLIFQRASAADIKKTARQQGMKTMRQHGWKKVLSGGTTPGEIIQVTPADEGGEPAALSSGAVQPFQEKTFRRAGEADEEESGAYVNRRAFVRAACELQMKFRVIDLEHESKEEKNEEKQHYETAMTSDISANGLSFSLKEEILPGTSLDLRIQLPGEDTEIQCIGRVVRVLKKLEAKGTSRNFIYYMGVTFLAINSTDRLKLERFCKIRSGV